MQSKVAVPMAMSVEKVRHEMLRGLLIPREMVNKAILTTYKKLEAQETKFFTHKGQVTATRNVDDHSIQLTAADQIFSLAGLYAREREERNSTPGVALEVDPVTGVIRISVGSAAVAALPEIGILEELPPTEASEPEQPVTAPTYDTKEGALDAVWKVVSDEVVE